LRQKYSESDKLSRSRVSELESLLHQKTQQVEQLANDNKVIHMMFTFVDEFVTNFDSVQFYLIDI